MTQDEKQKEPAERKERVIHARIPPGLEEDLRRLADALRMPMSNLVRNILHDTVTAVDRVGRTMEGLAQDVGNHVGKEAEELRRRWARYEAERGRPRPAREPVAEAKRDPLEDVFGFQEITLAVSGACAVCAKALLRGVSANLALTDRPGGKRIFVCDACLPTGTPYPTEDE